MPLTKAAIKAGISWSLANTVPPPFGPALAGPTALNFPATPTPINLSNFQQLVALVEAVAAAAVFTLDVTALMNAVSEAVDFAHLLLLQVQPVGSKIKVGPGATNGLPWMLSGTTPGYTINDGGLWLHAEPLAGPGVAPDPTHKTLDFTNTGGASCALSIVVMGGV